ESPASAADIEFFREGIGDGCRAGTEFAAWLAWREAAGGLGDHRERPRLLHCPSGLGRSDGGSGAGGEVQGLWASGLDCERPRGGTPLPWVERGCHHH